MKTYHGIRHPEPEGAGVYVAIDGTVKGALDPRNDVRNHSPDGFEWGYPGSGPSQLALALCIDALDGDTEKAQRVYHAVKMRLIAPIKADEWALSQDQVVGAIEEALDGGRPVDEAAAKKAIPDAS